MATPILLISDAPTSGTGLGRITKDLATRIAAHMPDVFRVATYGYGGAYSRSLPFPQYSMEMKDWVLYNFPDVWQDFAGDEHGIVLTAWDASRLLWLARPENCADTRLRKWIQEANFDLFGYFPMDATGPHDKLTAILKHTLEGFDKVLAYSAWAEAILRRTLWAKPLLQSLTFLPHGIDRSVFYERDREESRTKFGENIGARTQQGKWLSVPAKNVMVGIVATNQVRKDWGLGIAAVAELARNHEVTLWCHTDELERHFSIPALLNDFGLLKNSVVTTIPLTDDQMAHCYSACDVTLGIGLGEGFGFPIAESLACGTPCVHGNYGGAEFVPEEFRVEPVAYRIEGPYCSVRPVFNAADWTFKAESLRNKRTSLPEYLDWEVLWPNWERWLRSGVE